jgi:16S rRNA (guanine527-N7)-methyltransferase
MSLQNKAELKQQLLEGLQAIPLILEDAQVEKLLSYLGLLIKWNSVYNLTSIRDPKAMVKQHLLDSLAVVHAFKDAKNVLDVGSGGGLPGMVLAIVYPQTKLSMIDIVHKKTAFLNQVKAELSLKNVTVYTGRVEALEVPELFDVITSRAFSELSNFINWSAHLLQSGGRFIALKGVAPNQEIEVLPQPWKVDHLEVIHVPTLEAERHLVFLNNIH